jgi:hypothetical protein
LRGKVKLENAALDDNGDGEHSERWQDDEPLSDRSANDTGAHFTHPLSQNRAFDVAFTKTSARGKEAAAIPPTAFIQNLLQILKKLRISFKLLLTRR